MGEATVEQLTERAAGLFIWAKTVIEFMEEETRQNIDTLYRNNLHFATQTMIRMSCSEQL